jgi:hypothetical protein
MHNGKVKNANLVREHLQIKERKKKEKKKGRVRVGPGSRKENGYAKGADMLPSPFRSVI